MTAGDRDDRLEYQDSNVFSVLRLNTYWPTISPGIARVLGYAAGRPSECEAAAFISLNEHRK